MPGVTRWQVHGDSAEREMEAVRPMPGAPVDVYAPNLADDEIVVRLADLAAQLGAVSRFMQRVAWRTPPGLGQTSMHHNHRLGLMADRIMASDIGTRDVSWLGLVGPLAAGTDWRRAKSPAMRDLGQQSMRRLVASFRGAIDTREP
jgi:hypothetical protein